MKKLTVENFINEMSYDLRMEEMENVVLKYQEVLVVYFMNSRYNYKEKNRFHEVCGIIRTEKFMNTMEKLIDSEADILSDMAYVLVTATNYNFVDKAVKCQAMEMAYSLRYPEMDFVKNEDIRQIATTLSVWCIRGFVTDSFFRTKCAELVIDKLPRTLYFAIGDKVEPKNITTKNLFTIFTIVVPDLKALELLTALIKSDFLYKVDDPAQKYAIRLRSFLFELAYKMDGRDVADAVIKACESMIRFNKRNPHSRATLNTRYLSPQLLNKLVKDKDISASNAPKAIAIKETHKLLNRIIITHKEFAELV